MRDRILVLGLAVMLLGITGILHQARHTTGDGHEGPFSCLQCKIADSSCGDLARRTPCPSPPAEGGVLLPPADAGSPASRNRDPAVPRAPPTPV